MKYIVVDSGNDCNHPHLIRDGEIYDINPRHTYHDMQGGLMVHVDQMRKVSIAHKNAVLGYKDQGTYWMRRFQLFIDCKPFFEAL